MHEAVLFSIEEHVLVPGRVEDFVQLAERDDFRERQEQIERERRDIERRLKALVTALEHGGEVDSLVSRIRELESRLKAALPTLRPVPRLEPKVLEDRLAEWRPLLRQSPTKARAVLQRVLRGRLVFTPAGIEVPEGMGERERLEWLLANFERLEQETRAAGAYEFVGETRFDRLFAGITIPPRPAVVRVGNVRGTEHIGPEDTLDGDYGRILEHAHEALRGKLLASPTGVNPFPVIRGSVRAA